MADTFSTLAKGLTAPADKHFALVADAGADVDPKPRAIYCEAAGTITISDTDGTALPYTMAQGQTVVFRGARITSISGGTFYGWL